MSATTADGTTAMLISTKNAIHSKAATTSRDEERNLQFGWSSGDFGSPDCRMSTVLSTHPAVKWTNATPRAPRSYDLVGESSW